MQVELKVAKIPKQSKHYINEWRNNCTCKKPKQIKTMHSLREIIVM